MTHTGCVNAAHYWVYRKHDVTLAEFFCWNGELADVIAFRAGGKSTLIECKVTRTDFLRDKKKHHRMWPEQGMGDFRYYCCPKGLIKPEELPERWGLIYVYPSGHVKRVVEAEGQPQKNIKAEHHLLFYYARRAVFAGAHKDIIAYRSGL